MIPNNLSTSVNRYYESPQAPGAKKTTTGTVGLSKSDYEEIKGIAQIASDYLIEFLANLEKINKQDKEALDPILNVIYHTTNLLNCLESDENNLLNANSISELEDAHAILEKIFLKNNGTYEPVKDSKDRENIYKLLEKINIIIEELYQIVSDILEQNDAKVDLIIQSESSPVKTMESESMVESKEKADAKSNVQQATNSIPPQINPEETQKFELAKIEAREQIFEADKLARATMKLEKSERDVQYKALKNSYNKLSTLFAELGSYKKNINDGDKSNGVTGIKIGPLTSLIDEVNSKREVINQAIKNYEDYNSPRSVENICYAKQIEIAAAIRVLQSKSKTEKLSVAEVKLLGVLRARKETLGEPNKRPENLDAAKLLGKKAISGIKRMLHPGSAHTQAVRLESMAKRLIKSDYVQKEQDLATVHFTEKMLMQRLLEKSGVKNASVLLDEEISTELNRRPWKTIDSKFYVSAETSSGKRSALEVHSVTTPAGIIFNDSTRFKPESKDSPFDQKSCQAYVLDANKGDVVGDTATGGFNSHDTTTAHAVAAAHTSCSVEGKPVFGATRSGVNAAYDLTQEHLLDLPPKKSAEIILGLIGEAEQAPTKIKITPGGNTELSPTTTNPQALQIPKSVSNPIQFEIQQEVKRILLDPVLGKDLLKGIKDSPDELTKAMPKIISTPKLLVHLVEKSKPLCDLLARQAALNRAREVFLVEIARDPNFMTKIAANETLFFSSISLLTPDPLRDTLNRNFGMFGSGNEKAMLATQVKAWEDLQAEITARGIVVNGHVVKAEIVTFNFGVNHGGVGLASNPVIGELVSGWSDVNDKINIDAIKKLSAQADLVIAQKQSKLNQWLFDNQNPSPLSYPQEIQKLDYDIRVIKQLKGQIEKIWNNGSYKIAGNEPYKLPTRVALLSFILGGGTTFNCKSGKDRTGQLDVEAKYLAFQIHTNNGKVPDPDHSRSELERDQYNTFVFEDPTRANFQQKNTGYAGSKLGFRPLLKLIKNVKEFLGASNYTKA